MKKFIAKTSELCPILSLMFSFATVVTTTVINDNRISPVMMYFSAQVYLNWYFINRISRAAAVIAIENKNGRSSESRDFRVEIQTTSISRPLPRANHRPATSETDDKKLWYCDKCEIYTNRPSRHCVICKKCFHHRDHHCFFIGGCILRQNMGNFIIICVYTSFASIYSLTVLGPHLYGHLHHFFGDNSTALNLLLNFSFPIALARFLFSDQESCIVLITFFDTLFSLSWVCLGYGLWKFYACLTGRQRYFPNAKKRQDIAEIFGSYGLWNFVFPINAVLGAKSLPQQYEVWKEV